MAQSITLDAAVQIVRSAVRDTDGDSYVLVDIQRHIRFVLNEFVRIAKPTKTVGNITIPTSSEVLNITATLTDFHPTRFVRFAIGYTDIPAVDYKTIARLHLDGVDAAQPEKLAFRDDGVAILWPTPDVEYSATVAYVKPLGALSDSASVIPIEDEFVLFALHTGVPASLRYAAREQLFQSTEWGEFMAYARQVASTNWLPGTMMLDEEAYV